MTHRVEKILIEWDQRCDRFPVLSTVSNFADLFQKCVVLPAMGNKNVNTHPYFIHLQKKSFTRCFVLLIPGLGNIIIKLYDLVQKKYDNPEMMFEKIKQNPKNLLRASDRLLKDKGFLTQVVSRQTFPYIEKLKNMRKISFTVLQELALALIEKDPDSFKSMDKELRENKKVVLAAWKKKPSLIKCATEEGALPLYEQDPTLLAHADESLRNNSRLLLCLIHRHPVPYDHLHTIIRYAGDKVKNDENFILALLEVDKGGINYKSKPPTVDIGAMKYCGEDLKHAKEAIKRMAKEKIWILWAVSEEMRAELFDDFEFMLTAAAKNIGAVGLASKRLRNDPTFMRQAVRINGHALRYGTQNIKDDLEVVTAAYKTSGKEALKYADIFHPSIVDGFDFHKRF